MEFADSIRALAANLPKQLEHIRTEEATKNALVLPFISALGYNVFDPTEVVPEFTADVGTKKGEKVDYAVMKDGKPAMLFECKYRDCDLDREHASQLFRYFAVTEARIGVLTNGILYRFYSDLDQQNLMDSKPFFEIDMRDVTDSALQHLAKFGRSAFAVEDVLDGAVELKLTTEIKRMMAEQLVEPSDDFVRLFASQLYPGRITQQVRKDFGRLTARALHDFINDRVNERLKTALESSPGGRMEPVTPPADDAPDASDEPPVDEPRVVTTDDERDGYYIVKAIVRDIVDVRRVVMRDTVSYCGVLLDDNNRKPICRLRFNGPRKYLGLLDEQKQEERVLIEDLNDIYKHADKLRAAVSRYDSM